MSEKLTVRQFFQRFPDEDTCLDHVMTVRFGKRFTCPGCQADATFHRIATRKAYSCSYCGHHIYPCAGTIFQDSRTPLQSWFYAIYLFVTTRHGVSGMELHRVLGVTKKTGWRMGQQIRKLIGSTEGVDKLLGHIELDEAYVGGKRSGGKRGRGAPGKTIVMGMAERGGRVRAEVIPNVQKETLRGVTLKNVEAGSTVSTDELVSYGLLTSDGYKHGTVSHGKKEYAYYDYRHGATHHTNTVEGFWRLFKASVRGTHVHISEKYMDRYLNEFAFRASHREMKNAMFDLLIAAI